MDRTISITESKETSKSSLRSTAPRARYRWSRKYPIAGKNVFQKALFATQYTHFSAGFTIVKFRSACGCFNAATDSPLFKISFGEALE
jgi:hypothetical protein